jgi:hypothetical protein
LSLHASRGRDGEQGGAFEERAATERFRIWVLHGNLDKRDVAVNTRWPQVVN